MGLSCKASDVAITLKRAMLKRNLHNKENSLVIRSDNGPQSKVRGTIRDVEYLAQKIIHQLLVSMHSTGFKKKRKNVVM